MNYYVQDLASRVVEGFNKLHWEVSYPSSVIYILTDVLSLDEECLSKALKEHLLPLADEFGKLSRDEEVEFTQLLSNHIERGDFEVDQYD